MIENKTFSLKSEKFGQNNLLGEEVIKLAENDRKPTTYILRYNLHEIEMQASPKSHVVETFERKIVGKNYNEARKKATEFLKKANGLFEEDAYSIVRPVQSHRREYREVFLAGIYDQ